MSKDLAATVQRIRKALRQRLTGRASEALIQRLENHLDKALTGAGSLTESLSGIRTTVRLLIDEKLADELYQNLLFIGIASGQVKRT